eukprot:g1869.t1
MLSSRSECLPYFAFEYVEDPRKHASFEHLFTAQWRTEFVDRVDRFLERLPDREDIPKLYSLAKEIINNDDEQLNQEIGTKTEAQTINNETTDCENIIAEQETPPAKSDSFTKLSTSPVSDGSKIITETVHWEKASEKVRNTKGVERSQEQLDYSALGKVLMQSSNTEVFELLRAIRQRLMNCILNKDPSSELQRCVETDFLLLSQQPSLVEMLLARNDMNVTQELLFTVHAFCSDFTGRDYIAKLDGIVEILYAALAAVTECDSVTTSTNTDTKLRRYIQQTTLECLVAFVPNDSLCCTMIRVGLLPWLISNIRTIKASDPACSLLCALVKSQYSESDCVKELDRLCSLCKSFVGAQDKQKQVLGERILTTIAAVPQLLELVQESDEYQALLQDLKTLPVLEDNGHKASGLTTFDLFSEEMNNDEVVAEKLLRGYYISTEAIVSKHKKGKESQFHGTADSKQSEELTSSRSDPIKANHEASAKVQGSYLRSFSANNPTRRKFSIPVTYAKDDGLSNTTYAFRGFSGHKRNLQDDYIRGFSARRELPRTPNIGNK